MILDLQSLQSILLGGYVFHYSPHTEISSMSTSSNYLSDLPQLNSIQLGEYALYGDENISCSLILRGKYICLNEIRFTPTHITYFNRK